jgi:hypothetical protein
MQPSTEQATTLLPAVLSVCASTLPAGSHYLLLSSKSLATHVAVCAHANRNLQTPGCDNSAPMPRCELLLEGVQMPFLSPVNPWAYKTQHTDPYRTMQTGLANEDTPLGNHK